jgi:hypothetical protein
MREFSLALDARPTEVTAIAIAIAIAFHEGFRRMSRMKISRASSSPQPHSCHRPTRGNRASWCSAAAVGVAVNALGNSLCAPTSAPVAAHMESGTDYREPGGDWRRGTS